MPPPVRRSQVFGWERVLTWGFGGSLALAAALLLSLLVGLSITHTEVEELVRATHRQDRIASRATLLVSQQRAALNEALGAEGATVALIDEWASLDARLEADLHELEQLENPAGLPGWGQALPTLQALRGDLAEAAEALSRGERARAEELLLGRGALHPQEEAASELYRADRARRRQVRADLDASLESSLLVGGIVSALLLVGLLTTWIAMVRVARRQAARLNEHLRALQESNRDLDAFAGRAAHDLRTVLTPVALGAELLRRAGPDPEVLAGLAERFERAARTGEDLIDEMLAFSRANASQGPNEAAADEVVDAVLDILAPRVEASRARVTRAVEADLRVACSPNLLHLALLNVVGNALKFLDGSERRVDVTARSDGSWAALTVCDTGPGIAPEHLEQLGTPFFRVPGTRASGSGLGLSTVRRIVQARGGRLELQSTPGRGTTVRLLFPAAAARSVARSGKDSAGSAGRRAPSAIPTDIEA